MFYIVLALVLLLMARIAFSQFKQMRRHEKIARRMLNLKEEREEHTHYCRYCDRNVNCTINNCVYVGVDGDYVSMCCLNCDLEIQKLNRERSLMLKIKEE